MAAYKMTVARAGNGNRSSILLETGITLLFFTAYATAAGQQILSGPRVAWRRFGRYFSSASRNRGMHKGIRSTFYHRLLIPVLGSWLLFFQQSAHASNDRALTTLVTEAEKMAARDVLSPSDMAFFDTVGSIPLLGFITPMNVMSPGVRSRIRERTAAIIRYDLEQVERGQSSRLKATSEQLGTALQNVHATEQLEKAPDLHLVEFSQYVRASNLLPRDGDGGIISLYQASLLLEQWGVDPYGFEAHPYYCALGIKSLDSMNVHTTKFCS